MMISLRTGVVAALFALAHPLQAGAEAQRTSVESRSNCGAVASCAGGRAVQRDQIEEWVYELAPEFGLDPQLVLIIIGVESSFRPHVVSHRNAHGLMQLIPATAKRFGVEDILNPVENLRGGMAYLQWLMHHFDHDLELALAAYNAGEGAVQRYRGVPPFAETQAYVRRITRSYNHILASAGD